MPGELVHFLLINTFLILPLVKNNIVNNKIKLFRHTKD